MVRQRKSDFEFRQEASLSQQLAAREPIYEQLAGTDPKISKKIARLTIFKKKGWIPEETADLLLELLNEDRKAAFATSEQTDTITKLGLQMGRLPDIVDIDEDEE